MGSAVRHNRQYLPLRTVASLVLILASLAGVGVGVVSAEEPVAALSPVPMPPPVPMPSLAPMPLPAGAPSPVSSIGLDCAACATARAQQVRQRNIQKTHLDLLKRNNDYLSKLKANETSKAIKVKSNIVIIQLRLETMENEINSAAFYLANHGCATCPK